MRADPVLFRSSRHRSIVRPHDPVARRARAPVAGAPVLAARVQQRVQRARDVVVDLDVHRADAGVLLHLQLVLGAAGAHEAVGRVAEGRGLRPRVRRGHGVPLVGADGGRVGRVGAGPAVLGGPVAHVHLVGAVRDRVVVLLRLVPEVVRVAVVVPQVVHLEGAR